MDVAGGAPARSHQSRQLELGDIRASTIILTASTRQQAHVVSMRSSAQARTFTIAQAARIGAWALSQGARAPAAPLPDRVLWLTEQLNAQRGAAPQVAPGQDDIPDPHRGGTHTEAFPALIAAIHTICIALDPGRLRDVP